MGSIGTVATATTELAFAGGLAYFAGGKSLIHDFASDEDNNGRLASKSGRIGTASGAVLGLTSGIIAASGNGGFSLRNTATAAAAGVIGASLGGFLTGQNRGLETNGSLITAAAWSTPAIALMAGFGVLSGKELRTGSSIALPALLAVVGASGALAAGFVGLGTVMGLNHKAPANASPR